jgi:hypothetical protein
MTTTPADQPTLVGLLHELAEACIQHGRAIERGDDEHAAKAHRAAVAALEAVLLRVDPAGVAEARAILFRAETRAAG